MKFLQVRQKGPRFVRACKIKMHMDISEEIVHARTYNEHAPDQDLENPAARRLCASLRNRNALFCENLQQKCRRQRAYPDFFLPHPLTPKEGNKSRVDTLVRGCSRKNRDHTKLKNRHFHGRNDDQTNMKK